MQIEFVMRNLLAPLIDGRCRVVEVKATAESQWVNSIHKQLSGSVFQAGCSNWYINEHGRNAASWPGYASTYWKEACIPRSGVFKTEGGSYFWFLRTLSRWIRTAGSTTYGLGLLAIAISLWKRNGGFRSALIDVFGAATGRFARLVGHRN